MQSSVPVKRSGLLSVAAEQAAGEVGIADREGRRVRRRNCARLAWVVCAIGLGGCAQQPVPTSPAKPPINLSGYSPAFKEGFAAGCDTAKGQRRRD
ncbi:MAG: hypothetical protein IT537_27645 [Hyphomicrobiales bacterium]|nr:hypothetical protein [Hyphomicrobiales bacterium]